MSTIPRKVRERMLRMCGSICDEDGVHPQRKRSENASRTINRNSHRQLRLCRQVQHTLSMVLSMAPDPALGMLRLERVEPGCLGNNLKVHVVCDDPEIFAERSTILARLQGLEGWLRAEIAAAVTRKRVPRLQFELHPLSADPGSWKETDAD